MAYADGYAGGYAADVTGEVGYRNFTPDDGDDVIRNRALISRLNGSVRTAEDAGAIDEFGRFDYSLDGLYHRTEQYSQDYANLIVGEYAAPRRRISSLTLGPAKADKAATVYPAMLGPELGDVNVVRSRPIGGGAMFEQTCVVEGIEHAGRPGGPRTARLVLSPEFLVRALEDEDVSTLGYAQVIATQTSISAEVDLTGLTVTVTVGTDRRIRVSGHAQINNDATAGIFIGRIYEGANEVGRWAAGDIAASSVAVSESGTVLTPSPGSHTYKLKLWKFAGAGSLTVTANSAQPAFILVEDIGPA